MKATIALLPGDGIGPEVTAQAVRVLETVAEKFDHDFTFKTERIGGEAMDCDGTPLPDQTLETCRNADAIMLGAIGGPKWDDPNAKMRPEQGLLGLRKGLSVFANLRPVTIHPDLRGSSPLKDALLENVDLMVVRELTGGIYFGEKERSDRYASDLCVYTVPEIERITRVACDLARNRSGRLTSVDKANVLETSRLWRATVSRVVAEEYPDVQLEHILVDAAAMHLLRRPADFDVIVTENMFGDILTDEASMLSGSLGLLPSASLGETGPGLYEPIHGSAPDIAGTGLANPIAAILSAAMLLRHSLKLEKEAAAVEEAVAAALEDGIRTADLTEGAHSNTEQVGSAVCDRLAQRICKTHKTEAAVF